MLSSRYPPASALRRNRGLGCSPFARHYWGNRRCILFLRVLRCFTSPGFALRPYEFRPQSPGITREGLPHSEISGSKRVCRSPELIAAYHVLRRLLMPRHSPYALTSLTKKTLVSFFGEECVYPSLCNCQRTKTASRRKNEARISKFEFRISAPPRAGGRAWTRTRDLVLIRDAL
jgi:hypothetical protein